MPIADLFESMPSPLPACESFGAGAYLLRGFALASAEDLLSDVQRVASHSPFRIMQTPGGLPMSVAITNCGQCGWVSDRQGYRYVNDDPQTQSPWLPIPDNIAALATKAAAAAGYDDFHADACLINRYLPGTKMSLHQDKDEHDFVHPIVSVSLGLPAVFLFGGFVRGDKTRRIPLFHGDVFVWGGPDRLRFHGILPLKAGHHSLIGEQRFNLTLRRAR